MRIYLSFVLITLMIFGCSTEKQPTGKLITRKDYGNNWPFIVDEVYLDCQGFSVTVTANGTTYAVNGRAKDFTDYPDVTPIWAIDTSFNDPTVRKDIGPIIDAGLELCK